MSVMISVEFTVYIDGKLIKVKHRKEEIVAPS